MKKSLNASERSKRKIVEKDLYGVKTDPGIFPTEKNCLFELQMYTEYYRAAKNT